MPTKLKYNKQIKPKNAKRKIINNAVVKLQNGKAVVTVKKGTTNVKDSKNRK
jgi:hypothetical protein